MTSTTPRKLTLRERYAQMAKSSWFRQAYVGRSLGEEIPVCGCDEGQTDKRESNMHSNTIDPLPLSRSTAPASVNTCPSCDDADARAIGRDASWRLRWLTKDPVGCWYVECDECGMRGPVSVTEALAVFSWNGLPREHRTQSRKAS